MIQTRCSGCSTLLSEENLVGRFIPCKCGRFTPIGAKSYLSKVNYTRRCKMSKVELCKGVTLESHKITNKDEIAEFLKGKEKTSLKDIYAGLPKIKPHVIRAILNISIKKNADFERKDKGVYALKIAEKTPEIAQE